MRTFPLYPAPSGKGSKGRNRPNLIGVLTMPHPGGMLIAAQIKSGDGNDDIGVKARPRWADQTTQHRESHEFICAFFLDKIRNICYAFRLSESLSRAPKDGREDEKPRLFETLAHNLSRELGEGVIFLIFLARNPLKTLDSPK